MAETLDPAVIERLARIEAAMQTLLDQTSHIARLTENVTRMSWVEYEIKGRTSAGRRVNAWHILAATL